MIKEKSCGAVVYKCTNNKYLFLLENMTHGHISMPKGHMQTGESEADTALREIKEETNLDVNLDTGFRHMISYSPCDGHIKDVVYFVAKAKNNTAMMPQECEVSELLWKSFQDAKAMLTYDLEKQTLEAAYSYLLKTGVIL